MNNHSKPEFSIIIATFNAAATLQKCIDSIASQTYKNYQLIIIDGGSTDSTVLIIRQNQSVISDWVSEQDNGIYDAWNKGLSKVSGDWILFLGADDFLWNTKSLAEISSELRNIENLENEKVIYCKVMLVNQNHENILLAGLPWEDAKLNLKHSMPIPHQGTLHSHKLFQEFGKFDETYKIAGDYELLLRYLKTKNAIFIPSVTLTAMTQGGISSDPKNSLLLLKESRKAQIKHELGLSFFWMLALIRVHIRVFLWSVIGETRARVLLDLGRKIMGESPYWTKVK